MKKVVIIEVVKGTGYLSTFLLKRSKGHISPLITSIKKGRVPDYL